MNAIGIASASSSGIKAQFGSMVKPLQVGFAATRGVESAFMAEKGIKADTNVLDKSDEALKKRINQAINRFKKNRRKR